MANSGAEALDSKFSNQVAAPTMRDQLSYPLYDLPSKQIAPPAACASLNQPIEKAPTPSLKARQSDIGLDLPQAHLEA